MNIEQLIQQGVKPELLPLTVEGLTITDSLRWLPRRRLVVAGEWKGRPVIAKLFPSSGKGVAAFHREVAGLRSIAERNVRSPGVLDVLDLGSAGRLLIMEKLTGETALAYCSCTDLQIRQERIRDLIVWVRSVQEKGVVQSDIHLGNFFYTQNGWALLDAAACRFGVPGQKDALRNVASLMAQFRPLDVPDLSNALAGLGDYGPALVAAQRKRYQMILKKALRPCTEFSPVGRGRVHGMCRKEFHDQVRQLLNSGLDTVALDGEKLKLGGASTVVIERQLGWVVKRYNIKSLWHCVKRQLRRSRAENAWLAGIFLREIGVQTPLPVAYLEERVWGIKKRAWIVNEYQQGHGLDELSEEAEAPGYVLRDLADFFLLMRKLGFCHGDMKASNLLVARQQVSVIDLDSFTVFARNPKRGYDRDYQRLIRNWSEGSPLLISVKHCLEG